MRAAAILLLGALLSYAILTARWAAGRSASRHSTAAAAISAAPLERGKPVPDASLLDQDGNSFRLSDFRGRVLVTAFIYTRCSMPSMCPLAAEKLVAAQRALSLRDAPSVHFLVVSFDARDTPKDLKAFASRFHPNHASFTFATGRPEQVAALSHALGTYFEPGQGGVIAHNIAVSLIDRAGVLRRDFFGTEWTVEELDAAIQKVANSGTGERQVAWAAREDLRSP